MGGRLSGPALIADSMISVAAILGLWIVLGVLRRAGPLDAQTGRFRLGLITVMVFLGGRLLWWQSGAGIFLTLMLVAAALIPLAILVLTEGLLRRHAPPALKTATLSGGLLFAVLAFLPAPAVEPYRAVMLLAFQFAGFVAAGWLILRRERATLSPNENWLIDRIALSLALILPFLVTEFHLPMWQFPVRLGGVAILAVCWLAVTLGRSTLDHRATIRAFAVIVLAALAFGIAGARIAGLDLAGHIRIVALVLSALLVAATMTEAMNLQPDSRRDGLLRQIAGSRNGDLAAFLEGLRRSFATEGAIALGPDELEGFDIKALQAVFAEDPLRSHRGPKADPDGQLQALFLRYQVSHLMLVSRAPLRLIALNLPAMASHPGSETELRAIQRVALLLADQDDDRTASR